eukprot:8757543-Pyramimonas_sp.AAC.2
MLEAAASRPQQAPGCHGDYLPTTAARDAIALSESSILSLISYLLFIALGLSAVFWLAFLIVYLSYRYI